MTESHIRGPIDVIVALRRIEIESEPSPAFLVLRGSDHDHHTGELTSTEGDVLLGEPFIGLGGLLTG